MTLNKDNLLNSRNNLLSAISVAAYRTTQADHKNIRDSMFFIVGWMRNVDPELSKALESLCTATFINP